MEFNDIIIEDEKNFYLVIFEEEYPYYDKTAFLLFVAFCLVPFVLFTNFCWIVYKSNKVEPYLVGFCLDLMRCKFD